MSDTEKKNDFFCNKMKLLYSLNAIPAFYAQQGRLRK